MINPLRSTLLTKKKKSSTQNSHIHRTPNTSTKRPTQTFLLVRQTKTLIADTTHTVTHIKIRNENIHLFSSNIIFVKLGIIYNIYTCVVIRSDRRDFETFADCEAASDRIKTLFRSWCVSVDSCMKNVWNLCDAYAFLRPLRCTNEEKIRQWLKEPKESKIFVWKFKQSKLIANFAFSTMNTYRLRTVRSYLKMF